MYGPPRPQHPHMRWGYQHSPHNPQWRHPVGPRAPFRGQHQRFNHPRPPFPSGNDNYWCETCDRGFPTEDVLIKHKQQHQVNWHRHTCNLKLYANEHILYLFNNYYYRNAT